MSEGKRYWIFFGFVALVFLLGGGSRGDIWSLAALRPLSILAVGYALIIRSDAKPLRLGIPAWLVIALAVTMVLQLIPMPQSMWGSLPIGEALIKYGNDAGLGEVWRPLTLSPVRTQNSLFSLAVPIAIFLLIRTIPSAQRSRLLWPLIACGAASALWGLLQIIGPSNSALYTYRITNPGAAVGLFANRNHNAIFLASLIPLIGYFALRAKSSAATSPLTIAGSIGGLLFIVPVILVTGSRAGAILLMVALLSTGAIWILYARAMARAKQGRQGLFVKWALPLISLATIAVIYASYSLSRSRSLERLFEGSLDSELRFKLLPTIVQMAQDFFPFGSGFGTFDLAYKLFEPADALSTSYLNHAHNDALQFVLEGGLPGAIILLVGALWYVLKGVGAFQSITQTNAVQQTKRGGVSGPASPPIEAFVFASLTILLAGGIFDYPLRTPALMCAASILAAILTTRVSSVGERA